MGRKSYIVKAGGEEFKLRLTLAGQKNLQAKNPDDPILAIVMGAVDDPGDMEALLNEALSWEGNENPTCSGEELYNRMVDDGKCGSGAFMDLVLSIAHNAGLLSDDERKKVQLFGLQNVVIDDMRGTKRVKTVELDLKGTKIKVKIVNTLREAEKCIREIKEGKADYQLLEVMACPGGCINGGGQPLSFNDSNIKEKRACGLYKDDENVEWRKSHENPEIKDLYSKHLEKPNSHKAHELLHTSYSNKRKDCYIAAGEK